MRRSRVVNLNRMQFGQFISKNHMLLFLTLAFVIGIIIGTVSVSQSTKVVDVSKYFLEIFINQRTDKSFLGIMLSSLLSSLLVLLLAFVNGTSMLGIVTVPLFVALRGFFYGSVSSYVCSTYAVKGIAFNAVIIIPASLVFLVGFIWSSKESMTFSLLMAKLTLPRSSPTNLYMDFKRYCAKYIFTSVVILISAIVDAVLSCSFMGFFKL